LYSFVVVEAATHSAVAEVRQRERRVRVAGLGFTKLSISSHACASAATQQLASEGESRDVMIIHELV
jgi:hypothetical protein